ncbi:hypothetical protein C0991_007054 [Blastosporella zonata]|nr:hypothetical protein C0991_007054 [Blastosporella zonata]
MASLLERMNLATTGPVRHKQTQRASPYNRAQRVPKGDVDSAWAHDLYDPGSLSARLDVKPSAPRLNLTAITQKALREATGPSSTARSSPLTIKGASTPPSANVIEVANLLQGTTASDVAAIFASCGEITNSRLASDNSGAPRIRLTYKSPAHAAAAVAKYNNQPADGNILSVRVVGATSASTGLGVRLGGSDGLGLVRQEGSVDVLINTVDSGSKMRSDSLLRADPRAQVLVSPPGTDPKDYTQQPPTHQRHGNPRRGGRGGRGGGRRGAARRGGLQSRMDTN